MSKFPNIDKLEAFYRELGSNPSISYQERGEGQPGFFTVTRNTPGTGRFCSIGQGNTLAEALLAEEADFKALHDKASIARLERAAA